MSSREDWSSFRAPTKLVPESEGNCTAGPRKARNLRKALMIHEASIDSITSIWIALVVRQVKSTAQRLLLAILPLVRRALTSQGPTTTRPTKLNGGTGVSRSMGRSAILCVCCRPNRLLHLNTIVNGAVPSSLASDYPEPTASDQAECEMSPLMLYFFVIMLYQET